MKKFDSFFLSFPVIVFLILFFNKQEALIKKSTSIYIDSLITVIDSLKFRATKIPEENWAEIEDINFDLDMDALKVILVKRSFNDEGKEATLIEYEDKESDYLRCSRRIHNQLVIKFKSYLEKKKGW